VGGRRERRCRCSGSCLSCAFSFLLEFGLVTQPAQMHSIQMLSHLHSPPPENHNHPLQHKIRLAFSSQKAPQSFNKWASPGLINNRIAFSSNPLCASPSPNHATQALRTYAYISINPEGAGRRWVLSAACAPSLSSRKESESGRANEEEG